MKIKDKNYKYAFTLSEVLVTIGVISVIAGIMIPAVNKIVPDPNRVMFKKAYHTLEKAVDSLINDDYLYPGGLKVKASDYITGATADSYISMGFRYTTDTLQEAKNGATIYNKFCYYLSTKLDLVGAQTCPAYNDGAINGKKFATSTDGIDWYISPGTSIPADQFGINPSGSGAGTDARVYRTKIIVDVNGAAKGPNCTADLNAGSFLPSAYTLAKSGSQTVCPKPDIFIIGVKYDGGLRVGMSYTPETNTSITDQYALDILKSPLVNK